MGLTRKRIELLPDDTHWLAIALDARNAWRRIKRVVDEATIIDLDDFVPGGTVVRKNILDGSEVLTISDIGRNLFVNLANQRSGARFAEIDTAAERSIKRLFFHRIVALDDQDAIVTAKDANRERANMRGGHCTACEA